MIGWTFCSGIGAPEIAAPWVDWRLASEIERFPRAVLQHRFDYRDARHHRDGPRLWGDFTSIRPRFCRRLGIDLPDLIVAGTPCQAFSLAGARAGLDDPRGNLTLAFVRICHAIRLARPHGRLSVLWENVPGVLSDSTNAFGSLLAGFVGAMAPLQPPAGGTWPGEGMVKGPWARAAWSVLDAQWFGVAQRRRRVFLVVDFGNAIDPAQILLEPDRLRGDSPARRQPGKDVAAGTIRSTTGGSDVDHATAGHLIPEGVALRGRNGGGQIETTGPISPALRASQGGADKAHVFAPDVANPLTARMGKGINTTADEGQTPLPIAFDTTHITSPGNFSNPKPGDPARPLCATAHPPAIAFDCKGSQVQHATEVAPTLRSMGHASSHPNAGGHAAIAIQERADATQSGSGPGGAVFRTDDTAYTLEARHRPQSVQFGWAVRRLTPTECARLQGFPDDHTAITYRGKPASDGPQYKAYGNSMAVPVIAYILDRLRLSAEQLQPQTEKET